MKIEELIEKLNNLQKKHPQINVCIFDYKKNLGNDYGDGTSEGIYNFNIEVIELNNDDAKNFKEEHDKDFQKWIALSFDNDDYNEDGELEQ